MDFYLSGIYPYILLSLLEGYRVCDIQKQRKASISRMIYLIEFKLDHTIKD